MNNLFQLPAVQRSATNNLPEQLKINICNINNNLYNSNREGRASGSAIYVHRRSVRVAPPNTQIGITSRYHVTTHAFLRSTLEHKYKSFKIPTQAPWLRRTYLSAIRTRVPPDEHQKILLAKKKRFVLAYQI